MTTRRRSRAPKTTARRRRPARRARPAAGGELRDVIRLQGLSGRTLRDAPIPVALEPASVFRTLP